MDQHPHREEEPTDGSNLLEVVSNAMRAAFQTASNTVRTTFQTFLDYRLLEFADYKGQPTAIVWSQSWPGSGYNFVILYLAGSDTVASLQKITARSGGEKPFTSSLRSFLKLGPDGEFSDDIRSGLRHATIADKTLLDGLEKSYEELLTNRLSLIKTNARYRIGTSHYMDMLMDLRESSFDLVVENLKQSAQIRSWITIPEGVDVQANLQRQQALVDLLTGTYKELDRHLRVKYPRPSTAEAGAMMSHLVFIQHGARPFPSREELLAPGYRHEHSSVFLRAYSDLRTGSLPVLPFGFEVVADGSFVVTGLAPSSADGARRGDMPTAELFEQSIQRII